MKGPRVSQILFAAGVALGAPGAAADKLAIESPAADAKFNNSRIVLSVKVPSQVRRVRAEVTIPDEKDKTKSKTIFTVAPVELPQGTDRWSPEVELAPGKNTIKVSDADDGQNGASVAVERTGCESASDTRENFEATFYAGASIDSFAANETKNYIGYSSAQSGPQTGYVAGIDFAYRLAKRNPESRWPLQLWVYGETVHGQRSTEVDCGQVQGANGSQLPEVCAGFSPATAASAFLSILRNSSSLEGYGGVRLEFLKFNRGDSNSANLYAKSQLGFLTVQNNGGDVVDDHTKVALGTIMTNGQFRDSYLEVGYGRSDLFYLHRGRRLKLDGYVQWKVADTVPFYPFFQITVDADMGRGSDSIRTYYGINMDIRELTDRFRSKK